MARFARDDGGAAHAASIPLERIGQIGISRAFYFPPHLQPRISGLSSP